MQATEKFVWTLDHYHRAVKAGIFDDEQIELLEGELIEMAPEGEPHANRSSGLHRFLTLSLGEQTEVRENHPITLENSEPQPDIAVVQPLGREYDIHHPYPENIFWIIEFAETSLEKDLTVKRKLYATAGIPEYWVVNLKQRQVHRYCQPEQGEYQWSDIVQSGTLSPNVFPEVQIDFEALV
ncbi:MAG: Uma2 family endonuclease [Microcoleaceae cyanobacterium]